jgi:hypothetical protein
LKVQILTIVVSLKSGDFPGVSYQIFKNSTTFMKNLRSLIVQPLKSPLLELAAPNWDERVQDYEATAILHCPYLHNLNIEK